MKKRGTCLRSIFVLILFALVLFLLLTRFDEMIELVKRIVKITRWE